MAKGGGRSSPPPSAGGGSPPIYCRMISFLLRLSKRLKRVHVPTTLDTKIPSSTSLNSSIATNEFPNNGNTTNRSSFAKKKSPPYCSVFPNLFSEHNLQTLYWHVLQIINQYSESFQILNPTMKASELNDAPPDNLKPQLPH